MKSRKPPVPSGADSEMSALMDTLLNTGRRLEELTAGQVDTVVDRDGRTLFLQGTQEQLERSESARQAAILNALPAHIALLDAKGIIVSVNDAWKRFGILNIIQRSGNEIGQSYLDICDRARGDGSSEAHLAAEGIRSVLSGKTKIFSTEYSCHSPTEQRWFELIVTPLREDRQMGAVVMHINVTARRQMEHAVQANKKRLRDLIDGLGPTMFVGLLTPEGILIEANRSSLASAGLEAKDVLGRPFQETYWWSHSPKVQEQLAEAIARAALGQVSRYDVQVRGAAGQLMDVDFSLQPAWDETGKVMYLVPSASVITERKRAEDALRASVQEFRSLAEAMPQMVWITDADGMTIYFNQRWMDYTGLTFEESLGTGWNKQFHPEDQQRAWDAWQRSTSMTDTYLLECRLRRSDGVYRWWLIRGVPLLDNTGKILKWFGTCTDIHDLKIVEEALVVEKETAQVRLNSIGDSVFCTDISGNISFLNSVAEKMTRWSSEEAVGQPLAQVLRIKAAGREITEDPLELALGQNQTVHLPPDCVFSRRGGIEVPIEGSIAPIHNREGLATGTVIVIRDVTASRAMALEMVHLAEHDPLTGLPNRLLLNDRVSQAIALAPRHKKQVALLFLDLDGFKHINDSLGHSIGDKLLQSTGERLVNCVRAADTVSRQGGDEFVVLLSEVEHPEDAAVTARRIIQAVAEPQSIDQHDLHVTTSIGLSLYPDDGLDAETLVKNADTAMYQAKENGRQSYQFFKADMNVKAVERQTIEESLRRALDRQEFCLQYQPKIDLRTGRITGAEALIRWTHPTRGPVSPAQFIPVAEDSGLIVPIGNWVLHEACRQTRAWAKSGLPAIAIAVNVSALEFRQETFLEGIFAALRDTGLDPKSLELELTESVLMKRAESAASVLKELRARGIRVAVDDFGTGYSSLSYLRKFPIDALKIDQSFVRQITMVPQDTTIVSAIISMGRSLNLRVVAEGVETLGELEFLQAHQCDEAQGYYFSRPVPPEQFAKLLAVGIPETVPR